MAPALSGDFDLPFPRLSTWSELKASALLSTELPFQRFSKKWKKRQVPKMAKLFAHGKAKYWCGQCGGAGTCAHGFNKYTCVPCGGKKASPAAKCSKQNKRFSQCRDCGWEFLLSAQQDESKLQPARWQQPLPHNKRYSRFRECGGRDFCAHGKFKWNCKECKAL